MDRETAMTKVRKMCSGREYCSAQIASLFRRWNAREYLFGENEIAAAIAELERDGYICNARFVRAYARDKARFGGWGPEKILYKLREIGLPVAIADDGSEKPLRSIVEQALDSVDTEGQLKKILSQKWLSLGKKEEPLTGKRARLLKFALSRGYSYSAAAKAVAEITQP